MSSKSFVLFCLFLAISTLLVISEVAAKDLTETKKKTESGNDLNVAKYGGSGEYERGYGGYELDNDAVWKPYKIRPGTGKPKPKFNCNQFCDCESRSFFKNAHRYLCSKFCCRDASQVAGTVQPEAKPHN